MASYHFIEGLIVRRGYLGESGGGIMSLFTDDFLNPAKMANGTMLNPKALIILEKAGGYYFTHLKAR